MPLDWTTHKVYYQPFAFRKDPNPMLYYVPLEGYKERYTMQWSAPRTGWLERNWIKGGISYCRITGGHGTAAPRTIKSGSVVDATGRSHFCFDQIKELLNLVQEGLVINDDVILFDDFWTPGLEALPYAFHLLGVKPKMYAFLHAQSVDEFDFTYPMRHWMRSIETGFAQALDGIFVCCPTLKDLVVQGGIAPKEKVHVTGHPFNSEEVMERMPLWYSKMVCDRVPISEQRMTEIGEATISDDFPHTTFRENRKNQVVWSSRWDTEKNPKFFLDVAKNILSRRKDIRFLICTSAPKIRSNDPKLLEELDNATKQFPDNIVLLENLSKEEYYSTLCQSKIQFNCANQDFVAITLLEASVAGCYPIYPYFRSFPETFLYRPQYMYRHLDLDEAVRKIEHVIDDYEDEMWSPTHIRDREWIHKRFDTSWLRMLKVMGLRLTTTTEDQLYDTKYLGWPF